MKQCTRCKESKPLDQFGKDSRNSDNLRSWCKPCLKIYQAERSARPEVKAERRTYLRNKRKDPKFRASERARQLWDAARIRANDRNESFTLTVERIQRALEIGVCERSGIEFDLDNRFRKGTVRSPRTPSVDRRNPFEPYSDDNVSIVCDWYNMAKGQLEENELLSYCVKLLVANGYKVG